MRECIFTCTRTHMHVSCGIVVPAAVKNKMIRVMKTSTEPLLTAPSSCLTVVTAAGQDPRFPRCMIAAVHLLLPASTSFHVSMYACIV